MIPLLAPILGVGHEAGYQPVQAEGRKLFAQISAAVQEYLRACVRGAPALVLVEDMHWFDEDTVEAVQSLLSTDLGGHVLIVMTSRDAIPVPDGDTCTGLRAQTARRYDDVSAADQRAPPGCDADRSRRAVRHRCDGVPLYIEEVVAKLKEHPSDGASSAGVPDTLYEALFARLRSSVNAVQVVEAAAIIGSRIERALLLSAVDMPAAEVDEVLGQLVNSRVLEPLEQDSWRFRHELLREVGAELAPPSLRREMHSRIADSMASGAGSNPDWPLIARHYENAERYSEAAAAHGSAAVNAWQRGALGEARSYLTHGITQLERAARTPDRDRIEIGFRLRRALLAQAAEGVSSPNVAADFERCLQLCSSDLQDDDLFSTMMSLYPYYTMRADLDRADRLVRSIRSGLTGPRRRFLPINEFAMGMLAWYRGEFGFASSKMDIAADTVTEEAIRDLDQMLFMPNDATAGLFTHRALARYVDGDLPAAESELATAESRCAQITFPHGAFSLAYTKQVEVVIRIEAGQLRRAAEVAADVTALGEQHGFDSWALVGGAQQACVAAVVALSDCAADPTADNRSALGAHIATLTAFVDMWRALGVISLLTFYDALLARLLTAAGEHDAARDRLQIALDLAEESGMHFYDAELIRLRARLLLTPRNSAETCIPQLPWPAPRALDCSNCVRWSMISNWTMLRARKPAGQFPLSRIRELGRGRRGTGTAGVTRRAGKVAILGGGMAGLSAAWRLSEPGWRERFDGITVYQRGWRLGGKGASSRGEHGRIEEHGLHIWLGSYENAFALLRECYTELDRAATDLRSPIKHWYEALIPADNPGLADQFGETWLTWLGTHPVDDQLPGEPGGTGRELTVVAFLDRALRLLLAFAESIRADTVMSLSLTTSAEPPPFHLEPRTEAVRRAAISALMAAVTTDRNPTSVTGGALDQTLTAVRDAIDYEAQPSHRRAWLLLSLITAAARGIIADNLVTRPQRIPRDKRRGIRRMAYAPWCPSRGPELGNGPRTLRSGLRLRRRRPRPTRCRRRADAVPPRPRVVRVQGLIVLEDDRGDGRRRIAPLYQVLRRRGSASSSFSIASTHFISTTRISAVERSAMGRQVQLADGIQHYEPLTVVKVCRLSRRTGDGAARRRHRTQSCPIWSHISLTATMSIPRYCTAVSTSITSCSPVAGDGARRRERTHRRSSGMARDDQSGAHRGDPGLPTVAAAR